MRDIELLAARRSSDRAVQTTLGLISLTAVVLGLIVRWFAADVGLDQDQIESAAFAMLLTAIAHALGLYLWGRGCRKN